MVPGYEVVPNGKTPVPPLSAKQKFQIAAHKTLSKFSLTAGTTSDPQLIVLTVLIPLMNEVR